MFTLIGKTMGKIRRRWSDVQLLQALDEIRQGKSIQKAGLDNGIPRSTLASKLNGQRPIMKKPGPCSIMKADEEAALVQWILYCSRFGFPVTRSQLLNSVAHLMKELKRENPFTDGVPGRSWLEAFFKRHPEVTTRVSLSLSNSRTTVTKEALNNWFIQVEKDLTAKNLIDIDNSRVFNINESAFYLNPTSDKAIVKIGDMADHSFVRNDDKECLTVLCVANASGSLASPMILFSYERVPASITNTIPSGWSIGKSENGWMSGETFFEYISEVFDPWLTTTCIQRPVVLYVDGHSSHLTMTLFDFCRDHDIELIALLPNTTHLIHPLEVALFPLLNAAWKENVEQWKISNEDKNVRREDFGPLLKTTIESIKLPQVMSIGFQQTGLHPFSADVVNDMDFSAKENTRVPKTKKTDELICLTVLEKTMDPLVLSQCKLAKESGTWNGNVENIGLYLFWRHMLVLSSNS